MNSEEITEDDKLELMNEIGKELANKGTNIIAYIVDSESLLLRVKAEEERLAKMRKIGESKLDKFKEYVKRNMETMGLTKLNTELGSMSICKHPMSVEIVDEAKIPDEFKKEKVTMNIDKTAIKNHFIETGELIEGVKIVNDKTSLRIK